MSRFSLFAGAAALILGSHAAPVAAQSSNAARYLLQQELSKACEFSGGGGQISNGGLMERDFDGDGRDDLLIAHEAIRCGGSGRGAKSHADSDPRPDANSHATSHGHTNTHGSRYCPA